MRNCYLIVLLSFCLIACNTQEKVAGSNPGDASIDGHPAWIMQGNVYEVNVRQYTPQGTFNAFSNHLQRLKDMGVQTLWFMPIHPISQTGRKGVLGSYYAVKDYRGINPEFGTMDDWKNLVQKIHGLGMKVIIDWVPNHTGGDHPWLTKHPEFYNRDAQGNVLVPFDWTDVRDLNYTNMALQDSMIAAMKFWVTETDIDGFRCDVAGEVPKDFWTKAITELKNTKNVFMLAESNDAWLHETGFDASYPWDAFHVMKQIAAGQRPATSLDSVINNTNVKFVPNALRLYFTSNHDENSWNKADYATMPGAVHAPFAILTHTLPRGIPLIYSGQEEPFLDSVSFFYKDTISFGRFERAPFYKTLLNLRRTNPALAANAAYRKLNTNTNDAIFAFERMADSSKVLVMVNLSNKQQQFSLSDRPSENEWTNVFSGSKMQVDNGYYFLEPWSYLVYERKR